MNEINENFIGYFSRPHSPDPPPSRGEVFISVHWRRLHQPLSMRGCGTYETRCSLLRNRVCSPHRFFFQLNKVAILVREALHVRLANNDPKEDVTGLIGAMGLNRANSVEGLLFGAVLRLKVVN